jgi:hypothetical protein
LDAQTGAAIRVGNLGNKFRALSDLNSKEAQINAQLGNQTKQINAGIDAQNSSIINQYHDDLTNASIAQQREQSENLSNAADKFITQAAVKDQIAMEKDKATIYSKMYTPGVYNRFLDSLKTSGMDVSGYSRPYDPEWAKRGETPALVKKSSTTNFDTTLPTNTMKALRRYMQQRGTYAAGGMMKVFAEDPVPKPKDSPLAPISQFKGQANLSGTNAMSDNIYAMDFDTNRMASGIDMVNSVVSSGLLPNQTEQDRFLRRELDPEMYTYLYQFNQRPDLKGMTEEQRIQSFYNTPANNPNIQAMKANMRRYGHGPVSFRRGQPGGGVTPITPTAKRAYGGRIKPFA